MNMQTQIASPVQAETLPLIDAARPAIRYDFPKAWRHFKALIKNKEDTREVFPIFEALPWRGVYDAATAFVASPRGQELRQSEPSLVKLLDDHEALRKMPKGSLADHYCNFMESEGLSAQGLVDELDQYRRPDQYYNDQIDWYFNRMRDTHDLLHVLTGFGRDALGEQCVLAFTYSQQPALAHLFLGYAGALEIKKRLKSQAPVLRAVRQAQRMGKACPRLVEMSIRELLPLPIEDVRAKLGIAEPAEYRTAHATWRGMGVDPYDLISPEKKAA